jgi:hypothetical protein
MPKWLNKLFNTNLSLLDQCKLCCLVPTGLQMINFKLRHQHCLSLEGAGLWQTIRSILSQVIRLCLQTTPSVTANMFAIHPYTARYQQFWNLLIKCELVWTMWQVPDSTFTRCLHFFSICMWVDNIEETYCKEEDTTQQGRRHDSLCVCTSCCRLTVRRLTVLNFQSSDAYIHRRWRISCVIKWQIIADMVYQFMGLLQIRL